MPPTNLNDYLPKAKSKDSWKRIGTKKRSGVLVPLFSVYSEDSAGIGDFADLKLAIDWAKKTGNSIVQLLPLNEMGGLFCPYDAVSSFALEPVYAALTAEDKSLQQEIKKTKKQFPLGKGYVDYGIKKEKLRLLAEIYALTKGPSGDFKRFKSENSYWLEDFALYWVLKALHQGSAWWDWPQIYKSRDKKALEDFQKEHASKIEFRMWLEWQLYQQLKAAKAYAASQKILLKGDLPILVSRDSADVWQHPGFFKLEYASGAPADMYCAKGQRWGMPTYNWERIASDGYRYLKEKLKYAANFYDILRIDHVVGLFRIWSIPYNEPLENQGLNGFFDPQDEGRWPEHGREILSVMLASTKMQLCAEDLGVIPQACPDTLGEFGIPGNDVQRWAKDYKITHDFLAPENFRALSVAMLSTHDTTNWPAWWENEAGTVDEALFMRRCADHRQIDFNNVKRQLFDLKRSGCGRLRWLGSVDSVEKLVSFFSRRREDLNDFIEMYENTFREKEKLWSKLGLGGRLREKSDAEIMRSALKFTLSSSAVFCVNTLIDWLYLADIFAGDPYQYRINTPGTISAKNWSLALPLSLEELLKHKVNKEIRSLIVSSGRG